MYALILAGAMLSPEQVCANGMCPLARVATVALAPVAAVHSAVAGGCSGRSARFAVAPRASRGGCSGTVSTRAGCTGGVVASVAPPAPIAPPMPMVPPVVKDPPKAPESPVAAVSVVGVPVVAMAAGKARETVYRRAPIRTAAHNMLFAGMPF